MMLKKVNRDEFKEQENKHVSKSSVRQQQFGRPSVLTNQRLTAAQPSLPVQLSRSKLRESIVISSSSLPGFLRPTFSSLAKTKTVPFEPLRPSQKDNINRSKAKEMEKMDQHKVDNLKKSVAVKKSTQQQSSALLDSKMDQSEQKELNHHQMVLENTDPLTTHHSPIKKKKISGEEEIRLEESMSKCSIKIHTTPKCPKKIPAQASTTKRTLDLSEPKMSSESYLSPKSFNFNSYSFSMTPDDDPTLLECDGYNIFSTPIRNFAAVSSTESRDDESLYYTPCGEI